MIQKLFYAHIALFAVVILMVVLLMTERYTVPPQPKTNLRPEAAQAIADSAVPAPDTYASLGKSSIFDALYPKPTPAVTPSPTASPDPPLKEAISTWSLVATLPGGVAMFEDTRTKEDWIMNVGEVRPVKYRNFTLDVKLTATDENQFTATLIYSGQHGEQTEVKSMFEGSGVEE